jgi:diaminopimelate decarboxylase
LADLAARFGTPLYVTSERQLRENYRRTYAAFASRYPDVRILYANKANGNAAIRTIVTQEGAGGDCFGLGELELALRAATPPDGLVLNGSNKGLDELQKAIELGVTINVDHPDELETIAKLAETAHNTAKVNLRVLPFSFADPESLDPDLATIALDRSHDKWGMDRPTVLASARRAIALPSVDLRGLHIHVSRLRSTTAPFALASALMVQCMVELRDALGWTPSVLDIGGGFAHERDPESGKPAGSHAVATIESYADVISSTLLQGCAAHDLEPPQLWVEPGRRLVSNTTVLLTRVGLIKRLPTSDTTWVNVDASTNHVMRIPLQGYHHEVVPVRGANRIRSLVANVVGPNCTLDLIAEERALPCISPGEYLAILDVGGYAEAFVTRFNLIPRPATVLVAGDCVDVIRPRETVDEVLAGQIVPDRLRVSG